MEASFSKHRFLMELVWFFFSYSRKMPLNGGAPRVGALAGGCECFLSGFVNFFKGIFLSLKNKRGGKGKGGI